MIFDDVYSTVMAIADRFGVRADNHEEIFESILASYAGEVDGLGPWLSKMIPNLFPSLGDRPVWIQEEDWPTSQEGQPLVFIGQLSVPAGRLDVFHDSVAFFLFVDPHSGEPEIVLQEA